jgi:hypothetical protein
MDTTLTRTIDHIQWVSVWQAAAFWFIHRKDKNLRRAQEALERALSANENTEIERIYCEYVVVIRDYLRSRHPLSLPMMKLLARSVL